MAPELKDMILQIARAHQVPSTMDGAQGCHGEMFNHSGQENPKMLPEMSEENQLTWKASGMRKASPSQSFIQGTNRQGTKPGNILKEEGM